MAFVIIKKDEMLKFLNGLGMTITEHKNDKSFEFIYDLTCKKHSNVRVRFYTSVSKFTNESRSIGADAMRVVLFDIKSQMPFGSETTTKRTTG